MSHNSYVRPGGFWLAGVPVLHGELTQIDQTLFGCISGDNGGTWAPSSVITIGGNGLTVTGQFITTGTANLDHAVSIGTTTSDILEVFSTALFFGGANFSAGMSGSAGTFVGAVTAGSFVGVSANLSGQMASATIACSGTSTFTGALTANGGVVASGLSVSGFATLQGGGTLQAKLLLSGTGRVVKRVTFATDTAGPTTYGPAAIDQVIVQTISQDTTVKIDNTGVSAGDTMRFANYVDSTHHLIVQNPSGGTMISLIAGSGQPQCVDVTCVDGTNWVFSAICRTP